MTPVKRHPSLWLNVFLSMGLTISLLLVVLIGFEIYLRIVVPRSSSESIFEYTQATRRYKLMRRNARVLVYGTEFRTNNLGFRSDRDDVPPKAPGECRLIVLGDSFTVGPGVAYTRIYTSVLERQLRRRRPDVRVLNLGVGGYNPIQYALVLHEVALHLEPDFLVVGLFPFNDFDNETYEENQRAATSAAQAIPWYQHSLFYRGILSRIDYAIRAHGRSADKNRVERERMENLDALRDIVDTGARQGLPVVLAVLPTTASIDSQVAVFQTVETYCRDLRVPCLNVLDVFTRAGRDPRALRLNQVDDHPDETYHRIVGDALADYLDPMIGASC